MSQPANNVDNHEALRRENNRTPDETQFGSMDCRYDKYGNRKQQQPPRPGQGHSKLIRNIVSRQRFEDYYDATSVLLDGSTTTDLLTPKNLKFFTNTNAVKIEIIP